MGSVYHTHDLLKLNRIYQISRTEIPKSSLARLVDGLENKIACSKKALEGEANTGRAVQYQLKEQRSASCNWEQPAKAASKTVRKLLVKENHSNKLDAGRDILKGSPSDQLSRLTTPLPEALCKQEQPQIRYLPHAPIRADRIPRFFTGNLYRTAKASAGAKL